jgi:hypothetical protein
MILVCLSHIKEHFEEAAPLAYFLILATTRVATPTFLLLSGFVIGYLLRQNTRAPLAVTLIDRGLFLLIVAHLLLGVADLPRVGLHQWLFGRAMMTDVIGVALFVALLVYRASAGALIAGGVSLCVVSWAAAMTWVPDSPRLQFLGSLLFHLHSAPGPRLEVPLLAYLGVFMIGMALSAGSQRALRARDYRALARRWSMIGAGALGLVLAGIVIWHLGKNSLPAPLDEPHVVQLLRATLHPGSKLPPGPSYLLFYGGLGLLMTALFLRNRPAWLLGPAARFATTIGRASLACFVVQDWLMFVLPEAFGYARVTSVAFWAGYFALSVLVLYVLAQAWNRLEGNRFLTVGLKHVVRSFQPASARGDPALRTGPPRAVPRVRDDAPRKRPHPARSRR